MDYVSWLEKLGADVGESRPGNENCRNNGKDTNQSQYRDYVSAAGDVGGTGFGFHKDLLGFGGTVIAALHCESFWSLVGSFHGAGLPAISFA